MIPPNRIQNLTRLKRREVQAHEKENNLDLLKAVYDSVKYDAPATATAWKKSKNELLQQKSPMGNTVLHIAAMYGKNDWVEIVANEKPDLLDAKNANGDTAMHVAARAGQISTLERLLNLFIPFQYYHPLNEFVEKTNAYTSFHEALSNLLAALPVSFYQILDKVLEKNKQGNTFLHEALLNGHRDVMGVLSSPEHDQFKAVLMGLVERTGLFRTNNEGKSAMHLAIKKGYEDIVDHALTKFISQDSPLGNFRIENHDEFAEMIAHHFDYVPEPKQPFAEQGQGAYDDSETESWESEFSRDFTLEESIKKYQELVELILCGSSYVPPGKSLLIVAIFEKHKGILETIVTRKKEWIHLRDEKGRTALHYAASIGYVEGVEYLLKNCISCSMERDKLDGSFPLHMASAGGHAEIVKKLLEHCPDPREILDKYGRNIAHIAAISGQFKVVRYILETRELAEMINVKDANGNTPLHLAAMYCHPKIVYDLTWNPKVKLQLINYKNQTALDAFQQNQRGKPTLRQRLTFVALRSGGVQRTEKGSFPYPPPPFPLPPPMDPYKDRINTLILVSTLITTISFAAGFTLPGGHNGSDYSGQGMSLIMLHRMWFQLFILCITVSMYGSISVTILLIWAQLGDIHDHLALLALDVAKPLLGITLTTLSVAFLAGVHLVITDLNWLATTVMVMGVTFIVMLLLPYTLLWFPSDSTFQVIRHISHYPFLFLTWFAERNETKVISHPLPLKMPPFSYPL
ncbi:protein ACCELERATED CELL DEATH 6-like [Gastrolobium bilobum]|uniref:protein ACCELERATED CELL DEATH 6-like n=1 Tax=Gastrolobium bilobum TaxID=150636 RepID=UPI002AB327E5|nr:protein ACCELERATED CELL DEATH 6-like [Gastrolobium bilobum]